MAACSTTAAIVDDSGTPRNPDDVTPPVSTHITRRSRGPAAITRTSAVTGARRPAAQSERGERHARDPT